MMRGSDEAEEHPTKAAEENRGLARKSGITHKDLEIWKLGLDIVELVYITMKGFPETRMA